METPPERIADLNGLSRLDPMAGGPVASEPVPILIVDDQPDNLLVLEGILEPSGCEIVTVSSGEEALGQLRARRFSCLLLDVRMPGMDGFETAARIHEDPQIEGVPIIFLTAHGDDPATMMEAYACGAVDYLKKPVNSQVVRSKVGVFAKLFRQMRLIERQAQALRSANAELSRVNEELSQFTVIAAHDLKSPLATLVSYAYMLRHSALSHLSEMERTLVEKICKNGESLCHLIDDLLEYARLGRDIKNLEPFSTDAVAATAVEQLDHDIRNAGAEIIKTNLPEAIGDRRLISRVFQNLIQNALKYRSAERAPRIELSARAHGRFWEYRVADNGMGIPTAEQKAIFEPFWRRAETADLEGTGIGLAICRKVVTLHGGRIWVESEVGKGSTFCFLLPRGTHAAP